MRAVLLLALVALPALAAEVPVFVRERAGVARKAVTVRGGVPFARGALTDPTAHLLDAAGQPIPCRVRPTAKWYDGSVQWLLVDALVDVPANGEAALRLVTGPAAPAAGPKVTVSEDANGITCDTGPARFVFSKLAFGAPSAAWLRDAAGKAAVVVPHAGELFCEVETTPPGPPEEENWLRDAAGGPRERYTATPGAEYRAVVETADDLRVCVRLSGWLTNAAGRRLMPYVVRAYATAGQPELKLVVTLVYAGQPKRDFIRALGLTLAHPSGPQAAWSFGGATRHDGTLTADGSASLLEVGPSKLRHLVPYTEDRSVRYQVKQDGRECAAGTAAAGWARLADSTSSLHLAVRNFAAMHPKELRLDRRGATVYLWPEDGGKVLDFRRRYDEVENTQHYDLSLWEYGGEGVGLTQELAVRFGPAGEDVGAALSAATDAPLRLECAPQQYADSGAFGPFAVADPARYPHLEALQNVDLEWIRHNQQAFHWDGMIDFGDTLFHGYETPTHAGYIAPHAWGSRGYVGWLNNDGTLTHSLFLQYLRTGDDGAWRTAEAMVRHVTEVDTCHWCAEEPDQVGGGHRHDQQHWGNGVRGYGTATHGALDYYLLTGDERVLEVAREYVKYHDTGKPSENEDRIGGLIRMWSITGDPHLKQRADELLAAELNVPATSTWRFATPPHFRMVSNTSVSLLYYLTLAPPADAAKLWDAVVTSVENRREAWLSVWEDPGYLPLLLTSLAWQHTQDPKYAEAAAALVHRLPIPWPQAVPTDQLGALRALDFPGMVAAAKVWQTNNVYIADIHELVPLPYVLKVFAEAGLSEPAVAGVKLAQSTPPPFGEVLEPARISHEMGYCYIAAVIHGCPSDQGGGHSDLVLYEDGKPLGPAHCPHVDIRQQGAGRYSHWGAHTVYFSTSDNTDPTQNGRVYKVVYAGAKAP